MATNGAGTYAFTGIKAWAVVTIKDEDPITLELASVSVRYGRNRIPTANFKLAVGVAPKADGMVTAAAHVNAKKLAKRNPVKIYVKLNGADTTTTSWESKYTGISTEGRCIFDGYINMPSYSRDTGAAALVYNAVHWLSDLAVVSKFGIDFHPRGAFDYLKAESLRSTTFGNSGCYFVDTLNNIKADLWGNGFKAAFHKLASNNLLGSVLVTDDGGVDVITQASNKFILEALDKFDSKTKIKAGKLQLHPEIKENDAIVERILGEGITSAALDMGYGPTVWDSLLRAAQEFRFSIIPVPESAAIVPFLPISASSSAVTIAASDYSSVSDTSETGRPDALPLRRVWLLGLNESVTLGKSTEKGPPVHYGLFDAGKSLGDVDLSYGQTWFERVPYWLNYEAAQCAIRADDKYKQSLKNVGTSNDPDSKATPPDSAVAGKQLVKLGNALAAYTYTEKVFAGRSCQVGSRIRMDIGPGTPVKLELMGKAVAGYSTDYLWGVAEEVTCTFSAESGRAGMDIAIAFLHSEAEHKAISAAKNEESSLALTQHPLYTNGDEKTWNGTPLLM